MRCSLLCLLVSAAVAADDSIGLLRHVLLSITSFQPPTHSRLTRLAQTLETASGWPLNAGVEKLTVHIHTNSNARAIKALASSANLNSSIQVWEHTELKHPFLLTHQYKLKWKGLLTLPQKDTPTCFIYLEDDMPMNSKTLLSFARDTRLLQRAGLAKKGFFRSFFRTELPNPKFFPQNETYLIDNLRPNRVHCDPSFLIKHRPTTIESPALLQPFVGVMDDMGNTRWFVVPAIPYCAVVVLTQEQARRWVQNPLFERYQFASYPVREMAANGVHYANVEPLEDSKGQWQEFGFKTLVPVLEIHTKSSKEKDHYYTSPPRLELDVAAAVPHASNHYMDHYMKPGKRTQAIKTRHYFDDWQPGRCFVSGAQSTSPSKAESNQYGASLAS